MLVNWLNHTSILRSGSVSDIRWKDVRVGAVLKVQDDEVREVTLWWALYCPHPRCNFGFNSKAPKCYWLLYQCARRKSNLA